jgi:hypothetical protein
MQMQHRLDVVSEIRLLGSTHTKLLKIIAKNANLNKNLYTSQVIYLHNKI